MHFEITNTVEPAFRNLEAMFHKECIYMHEQIIAAALTPASVHQRAIAIIAYEEKEAAAIGYVAIDNSGSAAIKVLYTVPKFRRFGMAHQMLYQLEANAWRLGVYTIFMQISNSEIAANRLLIKSGYTCMANNTRQPDVHARVSFCKNLKLASEFLYQNQIEYFHFEEEFMEHNMRCIPMIVRLKKDVVGIKLRLSEWGRFAVAERMALATNQVDTAIQKSAYYQYVHKLITGHIGKSPKSIPIPETFNWNNLFELPPILGEKLAEFGWQLPVEMWASLTALQRFALVKLCRPRHENKNFPKAFREFKLAS